MKNLLCVNNQNHMMEDLSKRISPSAQSNQNLMDRIFILASTWPSSNVNEINRSLNVYANKLKTTQNIHSLLSYRCKDQE